MTRLTMSKYVYDQEDTRNISSTDPYSHISSLNSDDNPCVGNTGPCPSGHAECLSVKKKPDSFLSHTVSSKTYEETISDLSCLLTEVLNESSTDRDDLEVLNKSSTDCVDNETGAVAAWKEPIIDVDTVYRQDDDGDTLLHTAVILKALDLSYYFIRMTPCVSWLNMKNKLSQTPLHLAVLTNQVSLVRRLVVAEADLESRDQDGNTPVHLASRDNLLSVVKSLLEPFSKEELLKPNCTVVSNTTVHILDIKNYEGLSCLHVAASNCNLEMVNVLLQYGADVNTRAEKSGRTILHEAAYSGDVQLVKFLLALGRQCHINAKTYDDYTPFDLARSRHHWSIVLELATAGAKYDEEQDME